MILNTNKAGRGKHKTIGHQLDGVKKKKVCLLSDHHICFNPRLWKEAIFYERSGFEVVILNMWISDEFLKKDLEILGNHTINYQCFLNLIPGHAHSLKRTFFRARKKIAGLLQRKFHFGSANAISYAPGRMYKKAIKEEADMYAAHLECAFYAGEKLVKAGKRVSFDFEDWYSHDFLVPERPVKLLRRLEEFALQHGEFCTATSGVMAGALQQFYKTDRPVTVVYNGFSLNEAGGQKGSREGKTAEGNAIIWFSRSIGPDRGIENFIAALREIEEPIELHLLGKMEPGYQAFLDKAFFGLQNHRLVVHAFVSHKQLLPFLSKYKVGLASDVIINENRKLTITNKILQYLQAGLTVLASDTPGHREVAAYFPNRVNIANIEKPAAVGTLLNRLLHTPTDNAGTGEIFKDTFSWEAQEKKLAKLVNNIQWT